MTDRVHSFQVILAEDMREDEIEGIVGALKHVKGVLTVVPMTSSFTTHMAEQRAKDAIQDKLFQFAREL